MIQKFIEYIYLSHKVSTIFPFFFLSICPLVCRKDKKKRINSISSLSPLQYSSAFYSIPAIAKFQMMIHQIHSECLRLQRKATPMSHLYAFGPLFIDVASLENRTGFHPWSLVIRWNNSLWAVINPLLEGRITEVGGRSVFFLIFSNLSQVLLSIPETRYGTTDCVISWEKFFLCPLHLVFHMFFRKEVYTWTRLHRESSKKDREVRAVFI